MAECVCPPSSERLLEIALAKFDMRDPETGKPYYEFRNGGDGGNQNQNDFWEIDCSHMVNWAVNAFLAEASVLGNECYREVDYMSTKYFVPPDIEMPTSLDDAWDKAKYVGRSIYRDQHFCEVPLSQVGPGDIIVFKSGHMGIVEPSRFDPATGRWVRRYFSSTSHPYTIPGVGQFNGPQHRDWNEQSTDIAGFWRPKRCTCDPPPPEWPAQAAEQGRPIDPLILNLDGNGIRTFGLAAGIHFDQDANGFQESTGWVTPGNGVLMLDIDGNKRLRTGNELFGDFTVLPNGMRAANGFQALAQYDLNRDGKIDSSDPIWGQLKIWQYSELDLEAYDPDESGRINTLAELGITAIYLDSTITNSTNDAGNLEIRSGHFEWADGRTGTIGEYRLQRNTADTIPTDFREVPSEIEALPDLQGLGNVYNLHQAMLRDPSGQLRSLVEAFISATNPATRSSILEQIISKWTGADSVAPNSRGGFMDGRRIVALEHLYGESRANPDATLAIAWNETYRQVFEIFYSKLMAQSHLKELYETISFVWDEQTQYYKIDTTRLIATLQEALDNNPEQGKLLLSEFARTRRGSGYFDENCFLSVREAFVQQDPSLGWVIDSGGLPVYDQLGQGDGWWYPHMWGTWNSDAVKGSATQGDGYINGLTGDDVIYGTDRNEYLLNQAGDALLVGGGGSDQIWAGEGNDILDGGPGNDRLYGEAGNDTYIFRRGSGQDIIIDPDPTADNADTIWLGSNLTPEEVVLRRSGNNLVLKILDTPDTLTVQDYFRNDSPLNRIEQIQFMDGTLWTHDDFLVEVVKPSEGDDIIYGGSGGMYAFAA